MFCRCTSKYKLDLHFVNILVDFISYMWQAVVIFVCVQGKIRKKPKQEPIDVDEHEAGTAPLDTDDTGTASNIFYPLDFIRRDTFCLAVEISPSSNN